MHDQTTQEPGERMALADQDLLTTLTDDERQRPWSMDELARECGAEASESVGHLARAGLVHRSGDFVWATRAAVRARELSEV
jgi:predicted transcriptional regulator